MILHMRIFSASTVTEGGIIVPQEHVAIPGAKAVSQAAP